MLLSKCTAAASLQTLNKSMFNLPEKVLQFGTGVLLRGLPDYFIDKANRQGIFNGRIVVVKSTDHGTTDEFDEQDNYYTLSVRGYENGQPVSENVICSAISRVLSAGKQWQEVLDCAANKEMSIIISNTTEIGIQLVKDDISQQPPVSFPGKLLAFLYRRYQVFEGYSSSGMVIIPTELISENGTKLAQIILDLAEQNNLEAEFISWLKQHNQFCNSLVDRIVPGKPDEQTLAGIEADLGYQDNLLIVAEPYRLWAIEAPEKTKELLSFYQADSGVIIKPDINQYRELKLRLLNGTHTFCCGLAFLSGFKTVKEAMEDVDFLSFVSQLLQTEIAPSIPYDIEEEEKREFGEQVLDRFKNPTIAHAWLSITLHYTSKMKMRNVPLILNYYQLFHQVPKLFSKGFAAYLLFMKPVKKEGDKLFGELDGQYYPLNDEHAPYFKEKWDSLALANFVQEILQNQSLWGHDLNILPGFAQEVTAQLKHMMAKGVKNNLKNVE
ncbi:MAG: tagaturonate reductase [Sphingobacteriaceae bacterium]